MIILTIWTIWDIFSEASENKFIVDTFQNDFFFMENTNVHLRTFYVPIGTLAF